MQILLIVTVWAAASPCLAFTGAVSYLPTTEEEWQQETKNADAGNPVAQYNLCTRQIAKEKELEKARMWCVKAAKQGYMKAQRALSGLYFVGMGGPVDHVEAYFWLRIALQNGLEKIPQGFEKLPQLLTPTQIAQVEKRVQTWLVSDKDNVKRTQTLGSTK